MPSPKKVIVIGAGFAGLSAASFMARAGWSVTVIEKFDTPGGRARQLHEQGFRFDMGPSWYWMPDVFERYFNQFGRSAADYYQLTRLDPSYRIYWKNGFSNIPANLNELKELLESLESGAAKKLDAFLKEAAYKYQAGMQNLVYKPGQSITEFLNWQVISGVFRLDIFTSIKKHIGKYFSNPKIRQLLEFPVLFLGALPENTPALYSLMNYADIVGGTWYPQGGMYSVVQGMYQLAQELGVEFRMGEPVTRIVVQQQTARQVVTAKQVYDADVVIGGADYHYVEDQLLPPQARSYSEAWWNRRVMAPSCLLYYVGLSKKLKAAEHHMLFFDTAFDAHAREIYVTETWPGDPLFYVSASSLTDPQAAPEGCENLVFLVPVASGLTGDNETLRREYFNRICQRFEQHLGEPIASDIVYYKSFSVSDFVQDYHAFKGNAYGLANTLKQTAVLRPACRSRKVKNLFYTGQLTVPGPGVPPSLISGEVAATEILKHYQ